MANVKTGSLGFGLSTFSYLQILLKHNCIGISTTLFIAKKSGIVLVLNFITNWRIMEQTKMMRGILTCLGAQNVIQICRKMHLDLTIPNSLIGLPCLAGVAEC